jgi:ribosomal protein S12 methylthiotransferase accessory factor YcaO
MKTSMETIRAIAEETEWRTVELGGDRRRAFQGACRKHGKTPSAGAGSSESSAATSPLMRAIERLAAERRSEKEAAASDPLQRAVERLSGTK